MKIALHHNGADHQVAAMEAMCEGLEKDGHETIVTTVRERVRADLQFVWGIRNLWCITTNFIVLEAGYINGNSGDYINDRLNYVSFSVNGLHGLAKPHPPAPSGDRWQSLGIEPKPWREPKKNFMLVIGQNPLDAVAGIPYRVWARNTTRQLQRAGRLFKFRNHPLINPNELPLAEDLANADTVVTWCSTTAVEAVLEGIPTVAYSDYSISQDVCSRTIDEPLWKGDRTDWCHQLGYRQWKLGELADGTAWEWMLHVYNSQTE